MQTYVWAHKRPWNKNCVLLAVVAVINKSIEERNSFCLWYRQVGEVFQELFVIIVDRESYFTRQSQFWWILKKAAFVVGGLLLGFLSGRKSGWLLWCRRGNYWLRYWFGDWNCFSGPLFLRDSSAQCSLKASVCFGPLFTVIKSHTGRRLSWGVHFHDEDWVAFFVEQMRCVNIAAGVSARSIYFGRKITII